VALLNLVLSRRLPPPARIMLETAFRVIRTLPPPPGLSADFTLHLFDGYLTDSRLHQMTLLHLSLSLIPGRFFDEFTLAPKFTPEGILFDASKDFQDDFLCFQFAPRYDSRRSFRQQYLPASRIRTRNSKDSLPPLGPFRGPPSA